MNNVKVKTQKRKNNIYSYGKEKKKKIKGTSDIIASFHDCIILFWMIHCIVEK